MTEHRQIDHRTNCRGGDTFTVTGRLGDEITRCIDCRRFLIQGKAKREPAPAPSSAAPAAEPSTPPPFGAKLVCPPHWAPVRPNGRGCPACARVLEDARAKRLTRRSKSRSEDDEQ